MRFIKNINEGWLFYQDTPSLEALEGKTGVEINLPHSWNAVDGQDGGADYFRGTCLYVKEFDRDYLPEGDCQYIEIRGANSSADVYLNGKHLTHHDGGYSTFRVDLAPYVEDKNTLVIAVDNAENDRVYPQFADFTFYGGLYRDVNIISVPKTHFDLDCHGGHGLKITPRIEGDDATVEIEVYVKNIEENDKVVYTVFAQDGSEVAKFENEALLSDILIPNVHRWHGRRDPYLYTAKVEIFRDGALVDEVSSTFGCRTFEVDPNRGFILNGEEYPLRGVSRHQDRWGIGNALLPCHHEEDISYIMEVGATTIRLAHYQHDQYFYDLCDKNGLVIWAEIPYISKHMPTARENTISQMKELITQNYNHASIVVWGLSNEITMSGAKDPDLLENHRILNDLVHEMDKTRLTTMACVSMCDMDEEYVHIPDTVSYNHYFGWYGGNTTMNGPWFDEFHAKYPNQPIGCSEYGCEALNWHTSHPTQGDYTEEYQAFYHEELIKQFKARPYLWATHVWNMFDFGADARAEGGENGQNHKGLMTFDRSYKKDAFYAYKAWLSDEPFVHLCGKRYVDRVEEVTRVTVYSNLPEVELFVNGESLGKQTGDMFFYFDVPNVGESTIVAVAGEHRDEGVIRKVETMNEDYILREKGAVLNWFDIDAPEGRLSLNSTFDEILATFRGKLFGIGLLMIVKKKMKQNEKPSEDGKKKGGMEMPVGGGIMKMLGGFTVLRMTSLIGMVNISFTKEELLKMNKKLNRIRAKKK